MLKTIFDARLFFVLIIRGMRENLKIYAFCAQKSTALAIWDYKDAVVWLFQRGRRVVKRTVSVVTYLQTTNSFNDACGRTRQSPSRQKAAI